MAKRKKKRNTGKGHRFPDWQPTLPTENIDIEHMTITQAKKEAQEMTKVGINNHQELLLSQILGEYLAASEILAEGKTREKLIELVHNASWYLDTLVSGFVGHRKPKLDCKAGCCFCCYYQVDISIPETLVIAGFIKESWSADEIETLINRLVETREKLKQFADDDNHLRRTYAKIPCPLLQVDKGLCSVYDMRPITCRGHFSADVGKCESSLERETAIPNILDIALMDSGILIGLTKALLDNGLECHPVDLTAGLYIALTTSDVIENWLKGQTQFTEAYSKFVPTEDSFDGVGVTQHLVKGKAVSKPLGF